MNSKDRIKVYKVDAAPSMETGEGIMRPFLFTDNVSLIHLEIPKDLRITPHAHPKQGLLYCLNGELEVFSGSERFIITRGTAIVVPPNVAIGVNNNSGSSAECLLISSPPTFKSAEELRERLRQIGAKK